MSEGDAMTRRGLSAFSWIAGIAGIAGFALACFNNFGVTLPGILEPIAAISSVWLPILTLALGMAIGLGIREFPVKRLDLYLRARKLTEAQGKMAIAMTELTDQQNAMLLTAYEQSYFDSDNEMMGLIDPAGDLKQFLTRSQDPVGEEYGREMYRWFLVEDARRVGNEIPEVFTRARAFRAELQAVRDNYDKHPYD